jgi:phage protein U
MDEMTGLAIVTGLLVIVAGAVAATRTTSNKTALVAIMASAATAFAALLATRNATGIGMFVVSSMTSVVAALFSIGFTGTFACTSVLGKNRKTKTAKTQETA